MPSRPIRAAFASLLLCLAGPALADEQRIVPSGANQQIDFLASVNPDCSSPGLPTVRLIDGPDNGTVTTDRGRDFKPFAHGNVRVACNGRRLPGLRLYYKSAKGFIGTDHVRILVISAEGTGREARYAIQAR